MASKPVVIEEAKPEELVEINRILTNVKNALEPWAISADKVELVELSKDSTLLTKFKFIDLSILSYVFSLLTCQNCSALKFEDIEDKKKGLARFMQIKCRHCEINHRFSASSQIDTTKDNRCRGMKTMEINVRAVYSFWSIGVGHSHHQWQKKCIWWSVLFNQCCIQTSSGENYARCCRYTMPDAAAIL